MTDEEWFRNYRKLLAEASSETLDLARVLHRIAFAGEDADGSGCQMKGKFQPGPLYVVQAAGIVSSGWAAALIDAVTAAVPKQ